jgi:hypothetical protein
MSFKALLSTTILLAATAFFAAAADTGYIKASGKPHGPGVFVDGKYIGPAMRFTIAEKYELTPGEHEVTLKDPRHEEFTTKVVVKQGKTTKIKYRMKQLPEPKGPFGRLRLGGGEPESFMSITRGDVGAIYVNDKFMGYVDEWNNWNSGLLLNPGTYQVRIESSVFGTINQNVTIEAGKVVKIPLERK